MIPLTILVPQWKSHKKNDSEYNGLDRGQNGHEATFISLEQRKQNKTSSKENQESKDSELENAYTYSKLEKEKSDGEKDLEEHFYHVLEDSSN